MSTKVKKNQPILVFTRVRPFNKTTEKDCAPFVTISKLSKEVTLNEHVSNKQTKKFGPFDDVFGPEATQEDIFNSVVHPLIDDVLSGLSCTVFAYGQTGSGKTHTMVGTATNPNTTEQTTGWQNQPNAGIIPRAISHLFDHLKESKMDFVMKVSYLELYNEELIDLLASNESKQQLKIFEDVKKKGSVVVSGLKEETVKNKNDVYAILDKGSLRRQTAATLMNAQSSRSHTIFTITVLVTEYQDEEDESVILTGKLNLVDLAGSENIGKSGAIDQRAREAGNINKSLLTLGQVITALIEHQQHIPYRSSKLTRLLQDSLGGKTKTALIATLSPSSRDLEESRSSLDYANRARCVQNRPEVNQKVSCKFILREYQEEVDRLKRIVEATQTKSGIFIQANDYKEMEANLKWHMKELEEKMREREEAKQNIEMLVETMENLKIKYQQTDQEIESLNNALKDKDTNIKIKEFILNEFKTNECLNIEYGNQLIKVADTLLDQKETIHEKLTKHRQYFRRVIDHLKQYDDRYRSELLELEDMGKDLSNSLNFRSQMFENDIRKFVNETSDNVTSIEQVKLSLKSKFNDILLKSFMLITSMLKDKTNEQTGSMKESNQQCFQNLKRDYEDLLRNEMEQSKEIQNKLTTFQDTTKNILNYFDEKSKENTTKRNEKLAKVKHNLDNIKELFASQIKETEITVDVLLNECARELSKNLVEIEKQTNQMSLIENKTKNEIEKLKIYIDDLNRDQFNEQLKMTIDAVIEENNLLKNKFAVDVSNSFSNIKKQNVELLKTVMTKLKDQINEDLNKFNINLTRLFNERIDVLRQKELKEKNFILESILEMNGNYKETANKHNELVMKTQNFVDQQNEFQRVYLEKLNKLKLIEDYAQSRSELDIVLNYNKKFIASIESMPVFESMNVPRKLYKTPDYDEIIKTVDEREKIKNNSTNSSLNIADSCKEEAYSKNVTFRKPIGTTNLASGRSGIPKMPFTKNTKLKKRRSISLQGLNNL